MQETINNILNYKYFIMKKLYLSLLGILLAWVSWSVLANCDFSNSNYEQEWKEAYFWACNEWIISEWNINIANLNKELSRLEMAKMLNIFAMRLMWKEENPSNNCKWYSDLNQSEHLIANKSCYLWIMWIGINKFRPKDSVSRAEFGTVLSRILYWDTYNVTNWKYYEKHLKALKDNGVITNTNPNLQEKKWYVLLMLKRYIDNKNKENTKAEISLKTDGWYILKNWNDITLSNNKDSITISNTITSIKNVDLVKWDLPRTDSLQWPCAPWYHIPSKDEAERLIDIWFDIRKTDLYNANNEGWRVNQQWDDKEIAQKGAVADIFRSDVFWLQNGLSKNACGSYLTRSQNYESKRRYFLNSSRGYGQSWIGVRDSLCWSYSADIICFKTN